MSRLKRWAVGIAVGALVGWLGVLVFSSGSVQMCDHVVTDPKFQAAYGISYPTELCDQGGSHDGVTVDGISTGYISDTGWRHEGGNGWGALIAVIGFGILWWLIPVVLGIPEGQKKRAAAIENGELSRSLYRPQGYGQQNSLVWNTQADQTNDILVRIQNDGIYDIVSMNPHAVGDTIWAMNNRITLHLKKRGY